MKRRLSPLPVTLAIIIFMSILLPRSLAFLPGLAGLCAFALWPFFRAESRPLSKSALIAVASILTLALASSLWAIDPADALERVGKIALVLIPGALLIGVVRSLAQANFSGLWWVFPAATIAAGILLCIEYGFDFPVYRFLRNIPAGQHVGTYQ